MAPSREVRVDGVPTWVDAARLLGAGPWQADGAAWVAALPTEAAADVDARLRGLSLAGRPVLVSVRPPLRRDDVRAARTRDARARRDTSPGFSRPGARLDPEGRWSLTPEALALWLGRRARGRDVVDLGCGAGGNAIGFARAGCRVLAIERDAARLELARHNARVYGVADAIRFRQADADALWDELSGDLLWVDPPWGVDWDRERVTALPLLAPAADAVARGRFSTLWAKVPPSFDPAALPRAAARAVFGHAPGDRHRIKFVWLSLGATP